MSAFLTAPWAEVDGHDVYPGPSDRCKPIAWPTFSGNRSELHGTD